MHNFLKSIDIRPQINETNFILKSQITNIIQQMRFSTTA
jgi:hypothetical protein